LTPRGQRPGAGLARRIRAERKGNRRALKVSPQTVLRVVISTAGMLQEGRAPVLLPFQR